VLCLDPFHVVAWATKALDEVRRGVWNDLRRAGKTDQASSLNLTYLHRSEVQGWSRPCSYCF
jgi:transposase